MGKTKQVDLQNKEVSPVLVESEHVEYEKMTYSTDKFKAVLKSTDLENAESDEDREALVQEKVRKLKGAKVAKGDFDDAVKEILKKVGGD